MQEDTQCIDETQPHQMFFGWQHIDKRAKKRLVQQLFAVHTQQQ